MNETNCFETKSDPLLLQHDFLRDPAFHLYWHTLLDARVKRNRILERVALAGLAEVALRLGDSRIAGACYLQLYLIDAPSATTLGSALMLLRLAKSYQAIGLFADAWSTVDLVAQKLKQTHAFTGCEVEFLEAELAAWRSVAAENSTAELTA